jgi:4-carboxymuconolactone decarboxylase
MHMDERRRVLVRLSAALTTEESRQVEAMDEAVRVAPDQAEEVLLQSYLFMGYPVALNSLGLWRRRTGRPAPDPADEGPEVWRERGIEVCRAVYGHQYEALREVMGSIHPDLDLWAVVEGYGKVLGRAGLGLPDRELCVASLLAGIDATRQLHAHLRGCLNVGVAVQVVEAMLETVADLIEPTRFEISKRVWGRVRDRWQ